MDTFLQVTASFQMYKASQGPLCENREIRFKIPLQKFEKEYLTTHIANKCTCISSAIHAKKQQII